MDSTSGNRLRHEGAKVIVVVDCASRNALVGTAWQETLVFERDAILQDVVDAACKHAGQGGRVTLTVSRDKYGR